MVPAHPGSTNSVVIRGLDPRIHLLKRISRSGWISDAVQVTPAVVPANAGTHNPGSLLWQKVSHSSASSMGRGVWVPAFAGTTNECGARRPQKLVVPAKADPVRRGLSIQSLASLEYWVPLSRGRRLVFADTASHSRRMFCARVGLLVPPSPIRGRRECRAPDAPA